MPGIIFMDSQSSCLDLMNQRDETLSWLVYSAVWYTSFISKISSVAITTATVDEADSFLLD